MDIKYRYLIFLIGALIQSSYQKSSPNDPTYHAAVVEFIPSNKVTPKDRVKDSLQRMKDIIESNATMGLDILVFPEYVLNNVDMKTFVPDPADEIVPCELPNTDYFLTTLSCAARSRKVYVVLNVVEKELCEDSETNGCDEIGIKTYNTNVVLDREGRVISRYRKNHLYRYEWYNTNILPEPELATFETDFGVTFGHFICFDMLFYEPAQVLIKQLNITDIIYPTYWFSELPFLTAVQLQEGWAYANDVNLLAADGSLPSGKNSGSGIYAGKFGRLVAAIYEEPTTKILRAEVPKVAHRALYQLPVVEVPIYTPQLETKRLTKLALLRDYNIDIFTTKLLDANFTDVTETICHGNFCCDFKVKRNFITESRAHEAYRYRLVAYDGDKTTFQQIDSSALAVCAIITCTNEELYSCGHIFPEGVRVGNKYYFNTMNITGTFRVAERRLIMPSTVDAKMMPLSVREFDMTEIEGDSTTWVTMSLTSSKADLLTFGIYVNYYSEKVMTHNLNPPAVQVGRNSANSLIVRTSFAMTMVLLVVWSSFKIN